MSAQSVLFDVPGPKARARNVVYTVLTLIAFLIGMAVLYLGFNRTLGEGAPPLLSAQAWAVSPDGQWTADKWSPFLDPATWTDYVIPGLQNTLTAALLAAVLAVVFGLVFGVGRLSDKWWIRVPAGAVVEFFRGIPLLMLIFFTMALPIAVNQLLPVFGMEPLTPGVFQVSALAAVVTGLTLYNGSVLAEVFRAGINAVPKGQSEAAYSLGMNKSKVMRLILIPQAVTAMMPAIVAQLVVLLKDSALGYIIAFPELLRSFTLIGTRFGNVIPAAIICGIIYIIINIALSRVAIWLERRNSRRGRTSARVGGVTAVADDASNVANAPGVTGVTGVTSTTGTTGHAEPGPDTPEGDEPDRRP